VKFRNKYQSLLEGFNSPYSSIIKKQRFFYPRNFELSPEFIKAFNKEFSRLKGIYGGSAGDILRKINKALMWIAK
jgi:hypothetical protein